jgi:hypothetical protein
VLRQAVAETVAKRAAAVLDGHDQADEDGSGVRNHRADPSYEPVDGDEP